MNMGRAAVLVRILARLHKDLQKLVEMAASAASESVVMWTNSGPVGLDNKSKATDSAPSLPSSATTVEAPSAAIDRASAFEKAVASASGMTVDGKERPIGHRFSPYEFNGGTALGISGDNFAVLACDTRLAEGYRILSRDQSKAVKLSSTCVLGTGGCFTDVATLHKVLGMRADEYQHEHDSEISAPAMAQLLSTTLYYRRFFPYYAFNVLAGLDAEGKGAVYTYDAVGSFERVGYACQGAGQKLIIPLLDNLVGWKHRPAPKPAMGVEDAVELAKEAFVTACERDIYTGDAIEIFVIEKAGITRSTFELKKD